jgi:thiamine-phosphate diphosphorylase
MADLRRPILCLVTDRRRLPEPHERSLIHLVTAAARAGVTLIHLRERDLDDRQLLTLTRDVVAAAAGTTATIVVNDRVDLALAAGAGGVHLREDSVSALRVRRIVPDRFLIGRSVHRPEDAALAGRSGVDYIVMGAVYPTASKPENSPTVGVAALTEAIGDTPVPVLGIGGVTADNVGGIAAAGAAGIAAIGLFADLQRDDGVRDIQPAMGELLARIRRAFDTRLAVP